MSSIDPCLGQGINLWGRLPREGEQLVSKEDCAVIQVLGQAVLDQGVQGTEPSIRHIKPLAVVDAMPWNDAYRTCSR